MNKTARGCLVVFGGFFALLVVAAIVTNVSAKGADAKAKELCAAIPIGSTLASAQATARRMEAKEITYPEGTHRFAFHGGAMHQAECAVEVGNGVVAKTKFQVDDY